jgi:hypothetical protein
MDKILHKQIDELYDRYGGSSTWSYDEDAQLMDVVGDINLKDLNLEKLPFRFGTVDGDFSIEYSNPELDVILWNSRQTLKTLEGCPIKVTGSVRLDNLDIDDLSFFPKIVGEDIKITGCQRLRTLKGNSGYCLPRTIYGNLTINYCNIHNLVAFPARVFGDINLNNNYITSLEGLPKFIYNEVDLKGNGLVNIQTSYPIKAMGTFYVTNVEKFRFEDSKISFLNGSFRYFGYPLRLGGLDQLHYIFTIPEYKGNLLSLVDEHLTFFDFTSVGLTRTQTGRVGLYGGPNTIFKVRTAISQLLLQGGGYNLPETFEMLKNERFIDNQNLNIILDSLPELKLYL